MALATQCPHCKTSFRVAQDQLKLRGGIVRCGACHEIFDANAGLVDLDTLAAAPAQQPQPAAAEATVTTEAQQAAHAVSAHAPDAGASATHGIEPEAGAAVPADEIAASAVPATVASAETLESAGGELAEEAPVDLPGESLAQPEPESTEAAGIEAWAAEEPVPADASEAVQAEDADAHAADHVHEAAAQSSEAVEPGSGEPAVIDAAAAAEDLPQPELARAEPRPVFSMGSALLAHEARSAPQGERVEPTLEPRADEELVATALPGHHDDTEADLHAQAERVARAAAEHEPLPVRESADGAPFTAAPASPPKSARARLAARRSKLTPTKIAPPKLRVPEIDEPDFVKRGRQREETGKRLTIAMAVGSVLLALVLLAQAASTFRNEIAARFPATKPALASLCVLMRCRVELPAKIDNLTIETGELQTLGTDTYVLSTLLHNQGSLAQAWPDIELALTDGNDKPLVRRVFAPAEYLPKGVPAAAGFGAHAEQPVKLYFQLDQLKPSGYHIAVFYR